MKSVSNARRGVTYKGATSGRVIETVVRNGDHALKNGELVLPV